MWKYHLVSCKLPPLLLHISCCWPVFPRIKTDGWKIVVKSVLSKTLFRLHKESWKNSNNRQTRRDTRSPVIDHVTHYVRLYHLVLFQKWRVARWKPNVVRLLLGHAYDDEMSWNVLSGERRIEVEMWRRKKSNPLFSTTTVHTANNPTKSYMCPYTYMHVLRR